jgi:hypothetical protein
VTKGPAPPACGAEATRGTCRRAYLQKTRETAFHLPRKTKNCAARLPDCILTDPLGDEG